MKLELFASSGFGAPNIDLCLEDVNADDNEAQVARATVRYWRSMKQSGEVRKLGDKIDKLKMDRV